MMFQWPAVGTGSFCMATSITNGLPRPTRALERRLELAGRLRSARRRRHRPARSPRNRANTACRPSRRRVPNVVPKCAISQPGDGAERVVVHDHPDDGDVLLERRREHRRVLAEAAVADERDARRGPGSASLAPMRRRRAEAHRRVAARREDPARRVDRELLADAVLVPADVGRDDRVARQHRAHVGEDALGPHREGVARLTCSRLPAANVAR